MRHTTIKPGEVYLHRWRGFDWKVRVDAVSRDRDQERWMWTGTLVEDQDDCKAHDAVWGWTDELKEPVRC